MSAAQFPVVYGPGMGSVRDKAAQPLGMATTERGALAVAGRKLQAPAKFERRVAALITHAALEPGDEPCTVWSIANVYTGGSR